VIQAQYAESGAPVPPPLIDMITLTQNLASIVAPLSADVRATFTNPQVAIPPNPEIGLNHA
jgi:hypothetical protein